MSGLYEMDHGWLLHHIAVARAGAIHAPSNTLLAAGILVYYHRRWEEYCARWGFDMDQYLSLFRNVRVVGGVIAFVVFVVTLIAFGKTLSLEEWRNLALILGAMIGLPLALWRSGVAAKQVALAEAGHNTDRYQKGAAMLGDHRLSVRQAGVFALTELAEKNFDGYHTIVVKLLCSFIKDRSEEQRKDAEAMPSNSKIAKTDTTCDEIPLIAPDSETALNSLMEFIIIAKKNRINLPYGMIDLKNTLLARAEIFGGILDGVDLDGANMEAVHLASGSLVTANLMSANVRRGCFSNADLSRANFTNADLEEANLSNANLVNTRFAGANLKNANLQDANLEGASFVGANLEGAWLLGCNLKGAKLENAIGLGTAHIDDSARSILADHMDIRAALNHHLPEGK